MKFKTALQFLLSLTLLYLSVVPTFAQSSEVAAEVLACGTPVIDAEPEFTVGLENTVYWNSADLAVEYFVECSTDGSFGTVNYDSGWITQLTYTFDNLSDDTKYYYRVRARNVSDQEGLWSTIVFSTQDDNAPTSFVQDLPEEINTSIFNLTVESFDGTSEVSSITLFYRKDGGSWTVYDTYGLVTTISFNTNLVGGDGFYEFYSAATDLVGNTEYETAHADASTLVDTTIPPIPVCGNGILELGEECDDGNVINGDNCSSTCIITPPIPSPVCGNNIRETGEECDDGNVSSNDGCSSSCKIEVPVPTPDLFVLLKSLGGINITSLTAVVITEKTPTVTGFSPALKKINWKLTDSKGNLVAENYIRSNENGFFEFTLPTLDLQNYKLETYFIEDGQKISDAISFQVSDVVTSNVSGYAYANAKISIFYNDTWFEIGSADANGYFNLPITIPVGFEGNVIIRASTGEYFSNISINYGRYTIIENLLFSPIIYPSIQFVSLYHFAKIRGYAIPNSKLKIYKNGEFVEEIEVGATGEFTFEQGKFTEISEYKFEVITEFQNRETDKSLPAFVYISQYSIPYIYKVGELVQKNLGEIAEFTILVSEILTIVAATLTIFAGLLLTAASTISGYYYLLHDGLSFLLLFKPNGKIKVQVAGIDLGNKEGLLYLSDPASEDKIIRVMINSKGIGYVKKIKGIFDVCYIPTKNASWTRSIIVRKTSVSAYFTNGFVIKKGVKKVVVTFESSENLYVYPFTHFERVFDRVLLFFIIPITLLAILFSIIAFFFVASYSSLVYMIIGFVLLIILILMMGYHKTVFDKIDWKGY